MSNSIVLLLAFAGFAVPLSLLAGVSLGAASHCPGLERVPLPMRPSVKRAVFATVFLGVLVGLAPTLRDCWAGLDAASRVHPAALARSPHSGGITMYIKLGPTQAPTCTRMRRYPRSQRGATDTPTMTACCSAGGGVTCGCSATW